MNTNASVAKRLERQLEDSWCLFRIGTAAVRARERIFSIVLNRKKEAKGRRTRTGKKDNERRSEQSQSNRRREEKRSTDHTTAATTATQKAKRERSDRTSPHRQ
jgi:hypothetical protein